MEIVEMGYWKKIIWKKRVTSKGYHRINYRTDKGKKALKNMFKSYGYEPISAQEYKRRSRK